jgi:hypothetical protein
LENEGALIIKVLNGGGQAGLATKVVDKLKAAGYQQVSGANADNFDYQKTIIKTSALNQEIAESLALTLMPTALVEESASSSSEIIIILGKDYQSNE